MAVANFDSPIGWLTVRTDNGQVREVYWGRADPVGSDPATEAALNWFRAYFGGEIELPPVPCQTGGTDHQRRVWTVMAQIPYGSVLSYGDLAREIGSGPRSVGTACARNPIPLIIPCHRVVAAQGRLGGYSGGAGLDTKSWLLSHESSVLSARAGTPVNPTIGSDFP